MSEVTTPQPGSVYLCPGQLVALAAPTEITTIVASCVAVCLRDAATGVGGMCHFQLPRWLGTGARTASYADVAIQELLERMESLGARIGSTEAKLFGGACLTPQVRRRQKALGEENIEQALEHLRECGIVVTESVTGGSHGRKVYFQTADGFARVEDII